MLFLLLAVLLILQPCQLALVQDVVGAGLLLVVVVTVIYFTSHVLLMVFRGEGSPLLLFITKLTLAE